MKSLSFFILLLICISARPQQVITPDLKIKSLPFTMFWNTKSLFNPAASGVDNKYYFALTGGEQWMGINYSPKNLGVIMAMKSDFLHGAVGLNYVYTGYPEIHKIHDFAANYSYHINLGNARLLSAGVSGGLTLLTADYSTNVPPFNNEKNTNTYYRFQLGMVYRSNHLQLGLSSDHFEYTDIITGGNKISGNIHVYSSYRFDIGELFEINPELLISRYKLYDETIILSSGLLLKYKKRFWTGFTYRTDNTYGGMAGLDIAGIVRIGYCYEIRTRVSGVKNYGNHELLVAMIIK